MIDDTRLEHLRHELAEPLSDGDSSTYAQLGGEAVSWVVRHLGTLPEQAIGKTASRREMERLLREPPPEVGLPFEQVLGEFEAKVAAHAFRVNHPKFLAFIPGAPVFPSILGDWLCAGTNFFAGVWLEAAGPAEVEIIVLDWFKEFLGYPPETRGLLTGGGSEANLTALLVARERLSFDERSRAVLYTTRQRHWSVDRAAKVIGMRPDQLRPVPDDASFRLQPAALAEAVQRERGLGLLPWAVVANAGATNTGTVDPLNTLADLCQREQLWFHVDAAYGWPAVLTPAGRTVLDGIARADSVTLDPHKWLGQTFEAGCLLVRDGRRLAQTFAMRPDYMQDVEPEEDQVNFADHGLALTRRFRALKIWLSLKVLGVGWFRDLVTRCCQLAELAEGLLQHSPVFEILSPRQLSIVCFRYVPSPPSEAGAGGGGPARNDDELNQLNLALVELLRTTGRAFISSTRLGQQVALRFCFVNWRTTADDVEQIIRLLTELGNRLALIGK